MLSLLMTTMAAKPLAAATFTFVSKEQFPRRTAAIFSSEEFESCRLLASRAAWTAASSAAAASAALAFSALATAAAAIAASLVAFF